MSSPSVVIMIRLNCINRRIKIYKFKHSVTVDKFTKEYVRRMDFHERSLIKTHLGSLDSLNIEKIYNGKLNTYNKTTTQIKNRLKQKIKDAINKSTEKFYPHYPATPINDILFIVLIRNNSNEGIKYTYKLIKIKDKDYENM